jgi:hypothetical protein
MEHPILHGRKPLAAPTIVLNDEKPHPRNLSALLTGGAPRALSRHDRTPISAVDEPRKMEEEATQKQHFPEEEEVTRWRAIEEKKQQICEE